MNLLRFFKENLSKQNLGTKVLIITYCCFIFSIPYQIRYSNLGLICIGTGFLFFSFRKFNLSIFYNKAFQLLLVNIFIFLAGLSLINIANLDDFGDRIGKAFLLISIPILLFPLNKIEQKRLKIYLLHSFIASIIFGLFLIYFFALFLDDDVPNPFGYDQITRGIGYVHPVYFSLFCAMSFFIVLEFLFRTSNIIHKIIYVITLNFIFTSMIVLNARMPLIALSVSLLLYIFWKAVLFKNYKVILFVILTVLLSISLLYIFGEKNQLNLIKDRLINNFFLGLSSRVEIWKCSWSIYKENNSLFFGLGSGNVQPLLNECYRQNFLTRPYFEEFNPHNEHLMVLIRNGVLGLITWFLMLIYGLYKSISQKNFLGFVFIILFSIGALTEVYLNRIWGILFFGTFYSLFIVNDLEKEFWFKNR